MKHWYMLTLVGQDRPGIVAALADALFRAGANLGEASMVRLGGNFTIMMMAETEMSDASLRHALEPEIRQFGLHTHIDAIEGKLHQHLTPNVQVTVHGADRPGIVAQVTAALAAAGFNILDLDSDVGGSSEHPIYVMAIDGHVAGGASALDKPLAALHANGIDAKAVSIDTLVG
ncbi:MAG: ACT domain-containing protein [Pseudomonadota bacterium]